MKEFITLILLLVFFSHKSQVSYLSRVNINKNDSSLQVTNGDSSFIFKAQILTHNLNGISSFSLNTQTYNHQNSAWVTTIDTSYSWNTLLSNLTNTTTYSAVKINDNIAEISLGRLYKGTRKKFTIVITGTNGTLTKEFDF